MRIKSRVLTWGPVPPAAGATRERFLLERGLRSAKAARQAFTESSIEVLGAIGEHDLRFSVDPMATAIEMELSGRLQRWQALRQRLIASARLKGHELPGEAAARAALGHAVDANHDLAETDEARRAHIHMHHLGEYVSGIYGCWHEYDDGTWFETCPVRLAHVPLGASVGFTARRHCSICDLDITECDHVPGRTYAVVATRDDSGSCNICGTDTCPHVAGVTYLAHPHGVIRDADLHEVSLTPRPRDPRARITAVELDDQPRSPRVPGGMRRCMACLLPCPGLPDARDVGDERRAV